jgi:hypothetical protein
VLGVIASETLTTRWTGLRDETGRPFSGKVEGLVLDERADDRVFAVVDSDDHTRASELLEVALSGPWWR